MYYLNHNKDLAVLFGILLNEGVLGSLGYYSGSSLTEGPFVGSYIQYGTLLKGSAKGD